MTEKHTKRAHVVTGGFPPGASAGHDHDYARLRLLNLMAESDIPASVGNDFSDMEKWLPMSSLLVTYVAGPYPDARQCIALRDWISAGGHWLALHGTSGGRAVRIEGVQQRRTVKAEHHAVLGGFFLTHPALCRFQVKIMDHPLTKDVPSAFEVEDEPYFVELQAPAETTILLTARYGDAAVSDVVGSLYGTDTSLMADGETRVLGYNRRLGSGSVTYFALGHCHNPTRFRGPWETTAFNTLLRNAIHY